jgi:hypothetical protein
MIKGELRVVKACWHSSAVDLEVGESTDMQQMLMLTGYIPCIVSSCCFTAVSCGWQLTLQM